MSVSERVQAKFKQNQQKEANTKCKSNSCYSFMLMFLFGASGRFPACFVERHAEAHGERTFTLA